MILQENKMLNCCMVNITHLSSPTTYALVLCFNNNLACFFPLPWLKAQMGLFAYRERKSWDAHIFSLRVLASVPTDENLQKTIQM